MVTAIEGVVTLRNEATTRILRTSNTSARLESILDGLRQQLRRKSLSRLPSWPPHTTEAAIVTAIEGAVTLLRETRASPSMNASARLETLVRGLRRDLRRAMHSRGCHEDPILVASVSTCPSSNWQQAIAPLLAAPSMTLLNIGANKGYNLVEFALRYGTPASNLSHRSWHFSLKQHGCATQCCGVCGACRAIVGKPRPGAAWERARELTMHAFELQPSTAEMLRKVVAASGLPVHVHNIALSNASAGSVFVRNDVKAGFEALGIIRRVRPQPYYTRRPVTTVDAFITSHGINRVHFASIDTEGEDALVLYGV